jgi:hypothetical protein
MMDHEKLLMESSGIWGSSCPVRLQEMVSSQQRVATLTRTVDSLYWHKKWGRS